MARDQRERGISKRRTGPGRPDRGERGGVSREGRETKRVENPKRTRCGRRIPSRTVFASKKEEKTC